MSKRRIRPDLAHDRPRCWDCGRYIQQVKDGSWLHWGTATIECLSSLAGRGPVD